MGIPSNAIYHSDCLAFLERLKSEQVTLVYLDPPWGVSSELLDGEEREAGLREYWSFMSRVLQQVQRVLAESGSLYIHLELRLTGHIRLILDQIFGVDNFRTEIIWPRRRMGIRVRPVIEHEAIVLYSKSDSFVHNPQFRPLSDDEVSRWYGRRDDKGPFRLVQLTSSVTRPNLQFEWKGFLPTSGRSWRYPVEALDQLDMEDRIYYPPTDGLPGLKTYLSESPGVELGSVWDDIPPISPRSRESWEYPTQKTLALLERIVQIGSNPGDIVLDPFCGTGTALVAAQANRRRWLGCDFSSEAYAISLKRIEAECDIRPSTDFNVGDQSLLERKCLVIAHQYVRLVTPWGDFTPVAATRFVLNRPVTFEETRSYEFKEVKGAHVIDSIKSIADEYVVAFLNSGEGGSVYWGIRDSDGVVVGVSLNRAGRDKLRAALSDKLTKIQPSVDPTAYRVNLHEVYNDGGSAIPDLYVVEIAVPHVVSQDPYCTGKNEVFVKTDGGRKKLSVPEMIDFIKRRLSSSE